MKNLKLVVFFGVALILLLTFQAQAQEVVETGAKTGLFSKISTWLQSQASGLIFTFVAGFLAKGGYTAIIKKIAAKGTVFFTQLGHFSGDAAALCDVVDKSIKADNTVDQNSIKEVIDAGKRVVIDTKDMTAVFTPKPAVIPAV
jgi:hypothetical protein